MIEDRWGRKIYDITENAEWIREGFLSCMENYGFPVECIDWDKHVYKMTLDTGPIWKNFLGFQVILRLKEHMEAGELVTFHDDFCLEKLNFDIVKKSGKSVAKTATKVMWDILRTANRLLPSKILWIGDDEASECFMRNLSMRAFDSNYTPETGMKKIMEKFSVNESGLEQSALE